MATGGRQGCRSARLLSRALGLCRFAGIGGGCRADQSHDQDKIADYIRSHTFDTVVGDVAFGEKGEWKKARVLTIQFQGIAGTSVDDFRDGKGEVVPWPDEYKAGEAILPYSKVKH
jgi:hypothetical protein